MTETSSGETPDSATETENEPAQKETEGETQPDCEPIAASLSKIITYTSYYLIPLSRVNFNANSQ